MLDFLAVLGVCEAAGAVPVLSTKAVDWLFDEDETKRHVTTYGCTPQQAKFLIEQTIKGIMWDLLTEDVYRKDFDRLIKVFRNLKKSGIPSKILDEWFDFIENYIDMGTDINRLEQMVNQLSKENRELKKQLENAKK